MKRIASVLLMLTFICPVALATTGPNSWHFVWENRNLKVYEHSEAGTWRKHYSKYDRLTKQWKQFAKFLEDSLDHFNVEDKIDFHRVPLDAQPHSKIGKRGRITNLIWTKAKSNIQQDSYAIQTYMDKYRAVQSPIYNPQGDYTAFRVYKPLLSESLVFSKNGSDTQTLDIKTKKLSHFTWHDEGEILYFESLDDHYFVAVSPDGYDLKRFKKEVGNGVARWIRNYTVLRSNSKLPTTFYLLHPLKGYVKAPIQLDYDFEAFWPQDPDRKAKWTKWELTKINPINEEKGIYELIYSGYSHEIYEEFERKRKIKVTNSTITKISE